MKRVIVSIRLAGINARQELTGIFRYLGKSGDWDIRILPEVTELKRELAGRSDAHKTDGIIVDASCPDDTIALLSRSRIPLVTLDLLPSRFKGRTAAIRCVRSDDANIGTAAARHFLSCGNFASFAFVHPTGAARHWAQRREESFAAELSRHGHEVGSYRAAQDATPADDRRGLGEWLRDLPKPSAVFASWDGRARQVLEVCREIKAKVPGQIAVLGVDNDELVCESSIPPLSSVILDSEAEGFMAAKELDAMMNGRKNKPVSEKICRIKGIAQRESTFPITQSAILARRALAFIRANFRNNIGVRDVVAHLHVSRRLADKRFREIHGETILNAITKERLEYIASQLKKSNYPIKTLIPTAGFGSVNQAKVLFRRAYGMSMRDYRAANRTPSPGEV